MFLQKQINLKKKNNLNDESHTVLITNLKLIMYKLLRLKLKT